MVGEMGSATLVGPSIIMLKFGSARMRLCLGAANSQDVEKRMQAAMREIGQLKGVGSAANLWTQALAIFKQQGFYQVDT